MSAQPSPDPAAANGVSGTVYLIHLDPAYKHARHYTGWAADLEHRLEEHRAGIGARLLDVQQQAGGAWHVVRTWPGTRALERAIKDMRMTPRLCPECTPNPLPLTKGRASRMRPEPAPAARPQPQVLPSPTVVPARERGAHLAQVRIGQLLAAGKSADEISVLEQHIWSDFDPATAKPAALESRLGYQAKADEMLRLAWPELQPAPAPDVIHAGPQADAEPGPEAAPYAQAEPEAAPAAEPELEAQT